MLISDLRTDQVVLTEGWIVFHVESVNSASSAISVSAVKIGQVNAEKNAAKQTCSYVRTKCSKRIEWRGEDLKRIDAVMLSTTRDLFEAQMEYSQWDSSCQSPIQLGQLRLRSGAERKSDIARAQIFRYERKSAKERQRLERSTERASERSSLRKQRTNLARDLIRAARGYFSDAHVAREFIESMRFPGGEAVCPVCAGRTHWFFENRRAWKCKLCRTYFLATTGTPIAAHRLPLDELMIAAFVIVNYPEVSSYLLRDVLGITQKSAFLLKRRILAAAVTEI